MLIITPRCFYHHILSALWKLSTHHTCVECLFKWLGMPTYTTLLGIGYEAREEGGNGEGWVDCVNTV